MPGFNSFMGYDPASKMTLVVWTNLTVSLDGKVTANALMLKVLDQIYVVSRCRPRRRRLIEQSRLELGCVGTSAHRYKEADRKDRGLPGRPRVREEWQP